ncbi:BTB/POZ protein [Ochromonadaceae sp. CCMP2298]|nr:BTB/POZ protein [Ochromonadaceae sp. CCMP2298]
MSVPPSPSEQATPSGILKLDVGGARFKTTYATINSIDSMLSAMFSGRHALAPDPKGYHFIDRDGTHFRHILNLLRFPSEFDIRLSEGDLIELEKEVRYYGLSEAYALAREIHTPVISATSEVFGIHEDPDFSASRASFTVGDTVLPASCRGWNVLIYDPNELKVISQTSYDSFDASEMQQLATFLVAVPEGTIVAISLIGYGGANASLISAAMHSLGGIGIGRSDVTRSYNSRGSFAMVGCKGWAVGKAVEAYAADAYGSGLATATATRPATTIYKW